MRGWWEIISYYYWCILYLVESTCRGFTEACLSSIPGDLCLFVKYFMFIALSLLHCLLRTYITLIFHVLNVFIARICILSPNKLNWIELNHWVNVLCPLEIRQGHLSDEGVCLSSPVCCTCASLIISHIITKLYDLAHTLPIMTI